MGKRKRNRGKGITPSDLRGPPPVPEVRPAKPVSVSFWYIDVGRKFCLSLCTRDEVKGYASCLQKLTKRTWAQVLETGGKQGKKTGLAYTPYSDSVLRKVTRPPDLSEELQISAVRASDKARLFGAYDDGVYYVLWFDRNHEIVPVG